MPKDPLVSFSSHRSRPEWREYNARRFQNKMESLSLQEHQSELKVRAAEMAREQKIKNLNDRLRSQDAAIELMRQRHRNQTNDLRELCGRYQRATSVLPSGSRHLNDTNGYRCPLADLQKFTKLMDERYEKLKESRPRSRMTRPGSVEPTRDGVSYRNVKQMLHHLPVTPIFRETTRSLIGMARDESLIKTYANDAAGAGENGLSSPSEVTVNGRDSLRTRSRRDVMVPMKDDLRNGEPYAPVVTYRAPTASDLHVGYSSRATARANLNTPPKKSVSFKADVDYETAAPANSYYEYKRQQGPSLFTNRSVTFALENESI